MLTQKYPVNPVNPVEINLVSYEGSALPLAAEAANLIEEETYSEPEKINQNQEYPSYPIE